MIQSKAILWYPVLTKLQCHIPHLHFLVISLCLGHLVTDRKDITKMAPLYTFNHQAKQHLAFIKGYALLVISDSFSYMPARSQHSLRQFLQVKVILRKLEAVTIFDPLNFHISGIKLHRKLISHE